MNTPFANAPFRNQAAGISVPKNSSFQQTGKILSAGGVIYRIDPTTNTPLFLLVKRQAMSKKIEWIAPKGKIQEGETPEQAALRETQEEIGLLKQNMQVKQKLDTLCLQLYMDDGQVGMEKDITYFLIQYHGDPAAVHLQDGEGFVGQYVWVDIVRALNLITYRDLRELFRVAHQMIGQVSAKTNLIDKLGL